MKRHDLTDEQWGRGHAQRLSLGTGHRAAWRDLPDRFGPWLTVYDCFAHWRRDGVFAGVLKALQIILDEDGLIDWGLCCVDGSSSRIPGRGRHLRIGRKSLACPFMASKITILSHEVFTN